MKITLRESGPHIEPICTSYLLLPAANAREEQTKQLLLNSFLRNYRRRNEGRKKMDGQEQHNKTRVVKIDSVESWDFYVSQASNQGCPVRFSTLLLWFYFIFFVLGFFLNSTTVLPWMSGSVT